MTAEQTFSLNPELIGKYHKFCHLNKELNCEYKFAMRFGDDIIEPISKTCYLLDRKAIKNFIEIFIYTIPKLKLGFWQEDCFNKGFAYDGCKSSRTYFKISFLFGGKESSINLCKKCFDKNYLGNDKKKGEK